jgi:hypothetical protein
LQQSEAKQVIQMTTTTHLDALELGLSNERIRLANAKTKSEESIRTVWVKQYEKEIEDEKKFLGIVEPDLSDMSDNDLLAALWL